MSAEIRAVRIGSTRGLTLPSSGTASYIHSHLGVPPTASAITLKSQGLERAEVMAPTTTTSTHQPVHFLLTDS